MTRNAAVVGLSGWALMLAACSNPPAPRSEPAESAKAPQADEWRDPIVATTLETNAMSNLARVSGSFEIVNGCLSFVIGGETYLPVFNRRSPPMVSREGLVWGARTLEYGRQYVMGGGTRPQSLPINEEARQACRGTYVSLWGVPDPASR